MYKYSQFIRFDLIWVITFYWKPIASYGVMKLVASLNRKLLIAIPLQMYSKFG